LIIISKKITILPIEGGINSNIVTDDLVNGVQNRQSIKTKFWCTNNGIAISAANICG
jgi:hypothetical protein